MVFKVRAKKSTKTNKYKPVRKSNFMQNFNRALIKSSLIEQKRHRGVVSTTVSTTPSPISILGGLVQGITDLGSRVGDEISITKFALHYSSMLADPSNVVRIIIFVWCDFNSVAPVASDILDDSTNSITQLYGPLNEDNLKARRFRILYDKRLLLSSTRNYIGGSVIRTFKKPLSIVFSGGSSSVARNMPYLMVFSDSAAVTHPTFDCYHVSHYTDL